MVEAEPARDQVQCVVHALLSAAQVLLDGVHRYAVEVGEARLADHDRVHVAEQPVEVEVVAALAPARQDRLHRLSPVGPRAADLGEREVALRQLRATAVDPVEDVDHHLDGLVGAGHLLDVELDVADAEEPGETPDELGLHVGVLVQLHEPRDVPAQPRQPGLHQLGDVDPQGIAPHEQRLVEPELLCPDVEVEVGEGPLVAVEEGRRLPPDDPVERGDALSPVEQQTHDARRELLLAPVARLLGGRGPASATSARRQ